LSLLPLCDSAHLAFPAFPTRRSSDLDLAVDARDRGCGVAVAPQLVTAEPEQRGVPTRNVGARERAGEERARVRDVFEEAVADHRSEEHTSEPSHQIISYAVFCLKKKT